jgi:5-formyltetrahydrofolate cyclo-ligase
LSTPKQLKAAIRKRILAARTGLAGETVLGLSARIAERLAGLTAYRASRHVLFYLSFDNEVRTDEMIQAALAAGKTVYVPCVNEDERGLDIARLAGLDERMFELNRFGIREPKDRALAPVSAIDLALLPGLAFDARGGRVGFGAGYYDGLLKKFAGVTVALAFDFQVLDRVPMEERDVPVRALLTEKRTINCERLPC